MDGALFRWCRLWPRIVKMYGLEVGAVRPMRLADWMSSKAEAWDAIVKRHGLAPRPMDQAVTWAFGDFVWGLERDVVSSTVKIRQAGFHDTIDTEEQLLAHLQRYREAKLLP